MNNPLISVGLWFLSVLFSVSLEASQLPAPLINDIGNGGFKADTQNTLAQQYFNQGMVLFYGFDFLEAIRAFEASLKLDKDCSRCQFGLALSLGSITNAFVKGDELARANAILKQAKAKDPVMQGLFDALRLRYQNITQSKVDGATPSHCTQSEIALPLENKLAFSNALFSLTQKFPEYQTVKALFAYSVIGTINWSFYNELSEIRPYTNMMVDACLQILTVNPNHIGAIHYYIHATEWSKDPAQSLKYAENLAKLSPFAEHLVHMPTHLFLRIGDYNKAVTQNIAAIKAYESYEEICHQQGFKPVENFLNQHNYAFLFISAVFAGRSDIAYQAAEEVRKATPLEWLNKNMYFQGFYALKFYAIAHFGLWEELKSLDKKWQAYPYLKAMWAYTQGLHALVLHHAQDFELFFQKFMQATNENNANAMSKKIFGNNLAIAKEVLLANKARLNQHWEEAILHWQTATMMQSAGGDPPEWYFPTTLGLGYTFLDAGKFDQAILTFESSLAANPENGWALFGLAKAYRALGQPEKANEFENRFKKVWHPQATSLPIKQGSDLFTVN